MATKWRGWTKLATVKTICFLLAVISCVGIAISAFLIFAHVNREDPRIIFADFDNTNFFAAEHLNRTVDDLGIILFYTNEQDIIDKKYMRWEKSWWEDSTRHDLLVSTGYYSGQWQISEYDDTPEERARMEEELARTQLLFWQGARERLFSTVGLLYYIEHDGVVLTNTDATSPAAFSVHPVYALFEDGAVTESSYLYEGIRHWYKDDENSTAYLAFEDWAVYAEKNRLAAEKDAFVQEFAALVSCCAALLITGIILTSGAGRRKNDEENKVHYLAIDRPFIDLYACGLVLFVIGVVVVMARAFDFADYYNNRVMMFFIVAATAVLLAIPAIFWVLTVVKRLKGKNFLRHTFIYWVLSRIIKLAVSLWSGIYLIAKLVLIVIAYVISTAFIAWDPVLILLFTPALVVLLLWSAKRLYTLKIGAKNAASGVRGTEINVRWGEFGDIAESITNISAGIDSAVEERLKSERLKTELITNVSHDIRTPLTSIITYVDLLKNEGLDGEKAKEYLDVLTTKSQRLKILTDALFDAAKASTGNIEVNLQTVDLAALIKQVLGEMDEEVEDSGLTFRTTLPESARVNADGKLMWRVMENLLSNVLKYSLANSRVYIDISAGEQTTKFEIKNISAQPLNIDPTELTERFKRGDSSRSSEGSGLGLSIAQSFIAAQGGHFEIAIDGDLLDRKSVV